ncbi:hypothetical protein D3C71_919030 [compost metagenome]|jgi:SAM-dependent methyltransferase
MTTEVGERLRSLYTSQGGVSHIFSAKAGDYNVARPDYPSPLFNALSEVLGVAPGSRVADIGSGTGLFTRGLLERGYVVTAVEPNAAMRAAAEATFAGVPGYRGVDGSAEAIPAKAGTIDLITAAQAFHWFDIDRARAEFLRVLSPQGQVALVWNDRLAGDSLHVALDEILTEFGGEKRSALVSHAGRGELSRFFGTTTPLELRWPHEQSLTQAGLLSLVFSRSYMPPQESDAGLHAAEKVSAVFREFAVGKTVAVRYTAVVYAGRPA